MAPAVSRPGRALSETSLDEGMSRVHRHPSRSAAGAAIGFRWDRARWFSVIVLPMWLRKKTYMNDFMPYTSDVIAANMASTRGGIR